MTTAPGPTVLDAASLLCEVADELVVRTVRDTHTAWVDRIYGVGRLATRAQSPSFGERAHRGIASAVYAGVGGGLRLASTGLDLVAATGRGPHLESTPEGRFVSSAVNGLIGDRLLRERPQMAIPMAVRHAGADVDPTPAGLGAAFPEASGRLVVFLHGLCVQQVVEAWPVPVERIALVGHSMGGLVIRAAGAVTADVEEPWSSKVSDVVTLGTPHLGAPIAWGIGHGSRGLGVLPETAAFGRLLDWRSAGVHDLVAGLTEDVPPLPHARYRLVAATLTESQRHPVGHLVGDLLVRPGSAYGRDRRGRSLFPDADVLHVGRTDHFGLLNHPQVHTALLEWLA